jgi:hypothetical protein
MFYSSFTDLELLLLERVSDSNSVVVVFADSGYYQVLKNWISHCQACQVQNFVVISLDRELHEKLEGLSLPTLLCPCRGRRQKIWIHRVRIISKILNAGYDVIHSDADAVWLKKPYLFEIKSKETDMYFSQGTYWPRRVCSDWGFVLCFGFFFVRSNWRTRLFFLLLSCLVRRCGDDQVAVNECFRFLRIQWSLSDTYQQCFRSIPFTCSGSVIPGAVGGIFLRVVVLPHHDYQRVCDDSPNAYVKHPILEAKGQGVVERLKAFQLYSSTLFND